MRLFVIMMVLGWVGLPAVAAAEQRPRVWLRRITLAAACAASAWDVQSTAAAIGRGGVESNNMFTNPMGRVRWGRMLGIKVAVCGGMAAAQEIKTFGGSRPIKDDLWIGVNSGIAARFAFAAVRNRSVSGPSPGTR